MEIDPRKLPDMPELMIAGPGELHEEDLEIMGRQVIAHYGDLWTKLHEQTIDQLGRILGSRDLPYLIPGTGTACLDAAVANLFEAGQRVVVAQTGFFGTRLTQIAHAHGLEVIELDVEVGVPVDPTRVFEAAQKADGVLTVHVETATGVRHPIEEIAQAASDAGATYVVDGIASVGGEYLKVDEWGIDAVVTGTQKGLEAPPGYGILALGPGGRARPRRARVAARSLLSRPQDLGPVPGRLGRVASASGDDADEPDARARIIDGAHTRRGTRDLDRSPAHAGDPLPRGPERASASNRSHRRATDRTSSSLTGPTIRRGSRSICWPTGS